MATNWGLPTETSLYTDVLDYIDARLIDVAKQFPTTNTYSNLPTNTISFRSNKWQYWNGASWIDLRNYSAATPEYYDIGILGTASNVRGTVLATNGGTGKSSYVVGDLLTASSTTALSAIAAPVYGKVLLSQGTTTAAMPAWGSLNLQDHITGTLNVSNGGTGVTTLTTGLVKANGTSAFTTAVPGTDYAAASHTHSYLPLDGGTLTGTLSGTSASFSGAVTITNTTASTTTSTGCLILSGGLGVAKAVVAASATITGGLTVNSSNTTGTGIKLSDDGDIVDNNDAYCTFRFTSGVRIMNGSGTAGTSPRITLGSDGSITATSNITAYSDIRLKSNIRTIDNALNKTNKLRGVYYDKDSAPSLGIIAQEVEAVLPEVVFDNSDGYKSVAYGNIVGLLIEAIKELSAKVEKLENAG